MKSISGLLWCLTLMTLNNSSLLAQSNLSITACNELHVSLKAIGNFTSNQVDYVLEKQIIKDVWKKVTKKTEHSDHTVFSKLQPGTYRVSAIPDFSGSSQFHKTHIHVKGRGALTNETSVYISNSITLTGNEIPCNPDETQKTFSKPKHKVSSNEIIDFDLFPSPAKTTMVVNLSQQTELETAEVLIRNVNGAPVLQKDLMNQSQNISISTLQAGVYFVEVKIEGKAIGIKKILIMR